MIWPFFLWAFGGAMLIAQISGCATSTSDHVEVVVFAAASLTDVTEALAEDFEARNPTVDVIVSIGASSTLARQIASGAPADLFLSASPEWMEVVRENGRLVGEPLALAQNHLVVLGKVGSTPLSQPTDLVRYDRIAVADPSHVPAGKYAREGLIAVGIWEDVQSSLVPTLDVRAAVAALDQEVVDVAIVYASDALAAPNLPVVLVWPADLQPHIEIVGASLLGSGSEAGSFLAFLGEPGQQRVWADFGFDGARSVQEAQP